MTTHELLKYLSGSCPSFGGLELIIDGSEYSLPPGGVLTMEQHPESTHEEFVDVITVGSVRVFWCEATQDWHPFNVQVNDDLR